MLRFIINSHFLSLFSNFISKLFNVYGHIFDELSIYNMKKIFDSYIQSVTKKFSHEETSEMGYRADFEILLREIFEAINVRRIDHDPKAKKGNKPDFIVLKFDVPILYIEAKDIGISLDRVEKSEQMARYFGYANLVLTDYLEFRFYRTESVMKSQSKLLSTILKNAPSQLCQKVMNI